MIGSVEDKTRLVSMLRNTPIQQGQPGWNCVIWVKEVLAGLKADGKAMGKPWVQVSLNGRVCVRRQ
jgi:hypothetical protein